MGDQEWAICEETERVNERQFDKEFAQAEYTPPKKPKRKEAKR